MMENQVEEKGSWSVIKKYQEENNEGIWEDEGEAEKREEECLLRKTRMLEIKQNLVEQSKAA